MFENKMPSGPFVMKTGRTRVYLAWHSDKSDAHLLDILVTPGFDTLQEGTILVRNVSAAGRTTLWVPYCPLELFANTNPAANVGRTPVVADVAAEATTVTISNDHAARFIIGDEVVLEDKNDFLEELGPITAKAVGAVSTLLTITTAVGVAGVTVTNQACIRVPMRVDETDATEIPETCILGAGIETGLGAFGVQPEIPASGCFGNGVFRIGKCANYEVAVVAWMAGARVYDDFLAV